MSRRNDPMMFVLALIVVGACGGSSAPPVAQPINAPACEAVVAHLEQLMHTIAHEQLVERNYLAFVRAGCNARWSAEFRACMLAAAKTTDTDDCEQAEYARSPIRARCEAIAKAMIARAQADLDRDSPDAAATYRKISASIETHTSLQCVESWTDRELACVEGAKTTADEHTCVGRQP